ncbi:hypothetical protein BH10PSE7_BH10PSE7_33230 [soil metagenome]
MATISGGAGKDYIHRLGDGRIVSPGYIDLLGATNTSDSIDGVGGNDIILCLLPAARYRPYLRPFTG